MNNKMFRFEILKENTIHIIEHNLKSEYIRLDVWVKARHLVELDRELNEPVHNAYFDANWNKNHVLSIKILDENRIQISGYVPLRLRGSVESIDNWKGCN